MSGVFKAVGKVAGIVAIGATLVGAAPVAAVASAVAAAASVGAQLTAKRPPAQGSSTNITIGADLPTPYIMGSNVYSGGSRVHQIGYGGTVDDVPNPYAAMIDVYSGAGPLRRLRATYADFAVVPFSGDAATGWFSGFLYRDTQIGAVPEATALTGHWGGIPQWGSAYKLSGHAAILWNAKFDKKGKKFASGLPQFGAAWDGVYVYDPRQDGTVPGSEGSCRAKQEATYTEADGAADNPSCHAITYALGRYHDGKKVFGVGLPADGIVTADLIEFANVCDANGWKVAGQIFEPGGKWDNLKRILAAGGAEPSFKGGRLGLKISAPRVPLYTFTAADLADDDIEIAGMQTWRTRVNTIVPKYRSPAHRWEYVPGGAISVADYLGEDGEKKADTIQFDLVEDVDQASQLAAYAIFNGREQTPIDIAFKPHMRAFYAGDMIEADEELAELFGLTSARLIILRRQIDPASMKVIFTLATEYQAKHALALAVTGTAPPPIVLPTSEDLDSIASGTGSTIPRATMLTVDDDVPGEATVSWRNPEQSGWSYVKLFRSTTSDFADAIAISGEIVGGLGEAMSVTDPIVPGTFFYWVQAFDLSDLALPEVGPEIAVVT